MKKSIEFFRVLHQQYCTDHYEHGSTVVKAKSKKEAKEKLNAYLATNPDGGYTALMCKSINDVYPMEYLD